MSGRNLLVKPVVIGAILFTISAFMFVEGNGELAKLSACSMLRVCSVNMNPSSASFASSMFTARVEVAFSIFCGIAGLVILTFGLTRKKQRQENERREVRQRLDPARPPSPPSSVSSLLE